MLFSVAQFYVISVYQESLHEKSHKRKEEEKVIDIYNVETKTLIQEAHTTIGQTMSLREESHITDAPNKIVTRGSTYSNIHIKEEEKVILTLTQWKPKY